MLIGGDKPYFYTEYYFLYLNYRTVYYTIVIPKINTLTAISSNVNLWRNTSAEVSDNLIILGNTIAGVSSDVFLHRFTFAEITVDVFL